MYEKYRLLIHSYTYIHTQEYVRYTVLSYNTVLYCDLMCYYYYYYYYYNYYYYYLFFL